MIVFQYTKIDGAEYVSHLDTLRHINKIMRRADIKTGYSKGFNPHMHIFMSAPIAVGIKSLAEYCYVECDETAESFKQKFNDFSFRGLKCVFAKEVERKVNVAGLIDRAGYEISGIAAFDVNDVLAANEFYVTDKKGNPKEVRKKIFDLKYENGVLHAVLGFGNDTLRPDLFGEKLKELYGGEALTITKTNAYHGETLFSDYLCNLTEK